MEIPTNINWSVMTIPKLRLLLQRLLILKLYSMSVWNSKYFILIIPLRLWIFNLRSLIKVANSQKDLFVFDILNIKESGLSFNNHEVKTNKDGFISERFSQFFTTVVSSKQCVKSLSLTFQPKAHFLRNNQSGKTFCD